MTIFNLGSINIDHTYFLDRLPGPGETLAADRLETGLGGKGANQSIAIARAGGTVRHIGAISKNDAWTTKIMAEAGVNTRHVAGLEIPTGHAMITVDAQAENSIVLFKGANHQIDEALVDDALAETRPGDWLLLQNETNLGVYAAQRARACQMQVAYCAAPFEADAIREILPFTDLLLVNEHEAAQVRNELADMSARLDQIIMLVTHGSKGASYKSPERTHWVDAFKVTPVDTTGAGDTFLGFALAEIDAGSAVPTALAHAAAAAAIQVTRPGAAGAIPGIAEVRAFLSERG